MVTPPRRRSATVLKRARARQDTEPRPLLIHEHCKKLLLNSLLVLAAHNDHFSVAKTVLSNKQLQHATALSTPADTPAKDVNYMGECVF